MLELVQFEIKKIITSPFFRILILLVGLATIFYYGHVYKEANELYDQEVSAHEYWIDEYDRDMKENQELIDSGDLDDDVRTSLIRESEFMKEQIENSTVLFEAYSEKDWKRIVEVTNEAEEQWIKGGGFEYDDESFDQRTFTFAANINRNKLILERDVIPILPIDYSITYHNFDETDDEEARNRMKKGALKYSPSTLYYLFMIFSISFSVIGVILSIFLFGDVLTKEGIGQNGSIQLLYTQPIRKYQVLISKVLALIILTVGIIGSMWLLASILGLTFDRFGDGNYPIMVYGEEFTFTFINLSTYLVQAMILFGLVLLFSYSLLLLLSILTKRTLSAVGATIIIILVGTSIGTEKIFSSVIPYIPFNYFSVHEVITNELAITIDNFKVTYSLGIISLVSSILIIWMILLFMMRKVQD